MPKFNRKSAFSGMLAAAMLATAVAAPVSAFAATVKSTPVIVKADDTNLTVTVPTVIPFVMAADGTLTSASEGAMQIVNGSNFAVHVSGVSVAKQAPFNLVADATQAADDNSVDFQFGVDGGLIDASAPTVKAGSYNMEPDGGADTLTLKAQGNAKKVKQDIAKDKTVANITWTFAAGSAQPAA